MICLKIRTFVVSATTRRRNRESAYLLWFAWKFVPLWYQQQLIGIPAVGEGVVICLKIRTFVVSATTRAESLTSAIWLWFAWKFVPLWYQQQQWSIAIHGWSSCDLLENSYLCGISNNNILLSTHGLTVVICLKIRTFVVSATTNFTIQCMCSLLWFAWKFVPLWYQQQHQIYLDGQRYSCDLLENSYLCGISNNRIFLSTSSNTVVICLKIRTFVVSATTWNVSKHRQTLLWFAWKFVPLWYQQQHQFPL